MTTSAIDGPVLLRNGGALWLRDPAVTDQGQPEGLPQDWVSRVGAGGWHLSIGGTKDAIAVDASGDVTLLGKILSPMLIMPVLDGTTNGYNLWKEKLHGRERAEIIIREHNVPQDDPVQLSPGDWIISGANPGKLVINNQVLGISGIEFDRLHGHCRASFFGDAIVLGAEWTDPSDFPDGGLCWNTVAKQFRQCDGKTWTKLLTPTIDGTVMIQSGGSLFLRDWANKDSASPPGMTSDWMLYANNGRFGINMVGRENALSVDAPTGNVGIFGCLSVGSLQQTPSAALAVNSPDKGFLPPRLKDFPRQPDEGLLFWHVGMKGWYGWTGSQWVALRGK